MMQKTISRPAKLTGVGLHSGQYTRLVISPAEPGTGIRFIAAGDVLEANYQNVQHSPLCTMLVDGSGGRLSTIEHLMSAIHALGLSNLHIDVDGPEVPIMDGSALPFIEALVDAGIVTQDADLSIAKVVKQVEVHDGGCVARLSPADEFSAEVVIQFENPLIGRQSAAYDGTLPDFIDHICAARTFCLARDVEMMRERGLALGGSHENAVVFGERSVENPDGLRAPNEPARHKLLDAIGDLALIGHPIQGHYFGYKPGHRLTNMLLRKAVETQAIVFASTSDAESFSGGELVAA